MKRVIIMKIMIVEREENHTDEVEIMTEEVIVEVTEVVIEVEKEGQATTMMCITVTSATAMNCTATMTTDIHVTTPFSLMHDQIVWCRMKH